MNLQKRNKGAVVYLSSINSILPSPYHAISAASNCYTEKLAESLKYEYRDKDLHFQCLNPFFFKNKSALNKYGDGLKYAQYSIKTLGYSANTYGDWFMGLQVFKIFKNIFQKHNTNTIFLIAFKEASRTY